VDAAFRAEPQYLPTFCKVSLCREGRCGGDAHCAATAEGNAAAITLSGGPDPGLRAKSNIMHPIRGLIDSSELIHSQKHLHATYERPLGALIVIGRVETDRVGGARGSKSAEDESGELHG